MGHNKAMAGHPLRVLTWNLLLDVVRRPVAWPWAVRRTVLPGVLKDLDPDIACLQEVGAPALALLPQALGGHDHKTRRSAFHHIAPDEGEHYPIFWRRGRFSLLDHGHFWLSDTPDVPSRSFNWKCPQLVTWVRLEDRRTGHPLLVVNTHFGHRVHARTRSAELLARRLLHGGEHPTVVCGDFNTRPEDPVFRPIRDAGLVRTDEALGQTPPRTLHLYGLPLLSLDAVWCSPHFIVHESTLMKGRSGAVHASDHFGVLAALEISQDQFPPPKGEG